MNLQVKGRNVDVTDALFAHAEKKLGKLARHLSDDSRCEVELGVEHNPSIAADAGRRGHRVDEGAGDARAGVVAGHVRVDRSGRREARAPGQALPQPPQPSRAPSRARRPAPCRPKRPTRDDEETAVIVKQKQFIMKPMGAEEAALQLELIGHDFFVFTNADSDEINVIYKRRDGQYGLIEPARAE